MKSFYEVEMQEDDEEKHNPGSAVNRKKSLLWESISQTVGDASSEEDDEKV